MLGSALRPAVAFASLILAGSVAAAETGDPADVPALIDDLVEGSPEERVRAIESLEAAGSEAIPALEDALWRERAAGEDERRAVLAEIDAAVPDPDGRFRGRDTRDGDDFDWLAHLFELEEEPGLGSVIADAAAVRALAATRDPEAARVIVDFAFSEDGLVIRDECGRHLRAMAPHSIPALIRAAGDRDASDRKRGYTRYQLERIDREEPSKALAAAPDEELQIEILRAYGETEWREAVFALIDVLDDDSRAVRSAAREAWLAYVTGEPPPPAPRRRLRLAGDRYTARAQPLYRNSRELADHALRTRYAEVFDERPDDEASAEDLSRELFAHYDSARAEALEAEFQDAMQRAEEGDLAAAVAGLDALIVRDPDIAHRDDVAEVYLDYGEALTEAGRHREAARTYGKAYSLDPEGPFAEDARAGREAARDRALAAGGEDAAPGSGPVAVDDRPWLLFGGLGIGLVAVFAGVAGLAARRKRTRTS